MRINLIGPGRVGQTFLHLARSAGLGVQDVAGRNPAQTLAVVTRNGVGRACALEDMRPADLWLITVPDGAIAAVAAALADRDLPPAVAVHCSGFHPADVMVPLRDPGWHLASLHPVRSFADPVHAAAEFAGTLCGIEGDPPAIAAADALITQLGGVPFPIRSEAKALYHAAAVFSNNFTTVLQAVADAAWIEAGVPQEISDALRAGLLRNALENITAQGPQAALTGPAARGDHAVVAKQTAHLDAWHPEIAALYAKLSTLATRLKTTGKI